ncbi:TFIIB-type zinc ribbon-containing protein [Glycomyces xiaoerkulensis]|uniref:TFIIB-type zinc ribbon-containing protein n=1 Tax=Glycomyces xiaoerkulensis TaxID=2038139 RepID=UPI0022B7DF1D|nr:zf-TFIIB domain-containing protein [Glycomyces xiaoerkulensis]
MLCPKCQNLMRQYERNGVVVDQCTECKGIFLDRGELEHLLEFEASFSSRSAPPPPPSYDRGHYDDRRRDDRSYKKKKRRGIFEELFDFD